MIINVSKTQTSAFSTINEALEEAKKYIGEPITIKIDDGIYKEYIEIHQPDITFVGNDANKTILTFDNYAKFIMPDGEKRGTFRSMSVFINAPRFSAYNITFENNSGPDDIVGQALAAYIDSDCSKFVHCRFLGSQDTIFTAPLPPTAKEKNGFRGPKEFEPRNHTRQYFSECYIEGGVDFIFGSGTAYFDHCEIFCKNEGKEINSYCTAASTPEGVPFGYVFSECKFTSDCPTESCYLGRPWREFAKTVLLRCEIGDHIHHEGFHDWDKKEAHETIFYAEYQNYGPGADITARAPFVKQLSDSEASKYTLKNVLGDWALN